jgi:hypothetical protein
MITIKFSDDEVPGVVAELSKALEGQVTGGVQLRQVNRSQMKEAGTGELAGSFYDLIIEVLLSKVAEIALDKLYHFLRKLIRERKKAKVRIRVDAGADSSYLQDFNLATDGEEAVDKLAYQVEELQGN